jgi:phosphoserine phosphatase
MKPSEHAIEQFLLEHPHKVTPGIPELVEVLNKQGKAVFLVSGGFRQVIHPLADSLGIPLSNVFANTILFNSDGSYAGFDEKEFTCASGGKPRAIRHIKEKFGYSPVVMVGDGATDLEARLEGAAELFIGYGGVVERKNIAEKADWYIYNIEDMIKALK